MTSTTNKYLHMLIHILLKTKTMKYQNVYPLIKFYLEGSMPVTESSIKTLNILLDIFFNKCSKSDQTLAFFHWFIRGENVKVDKAITEDLLLRLMSNESIGTIGISDQDQEYDQLFDILFYQIDKCILFSEFEYKLPSLPSTENKNANESTEINVVINKAIQNCLEEKLSKKTELFNRNEIQYSHYLQLIEIVLAYLNVMSKSAFLKSNQVTELALFNLLETSLTVLFSTLTDILKSNANIEKRITILQDIRGLMVADYVPILCVLIRKALNEDFFHCLNNNLTTEDISDADVIYEGDETEMNSTTLKYHCVYVLAAYCRMHANYREELLEVVLNPKLYNFSSIWDVKCAYKTIEILNSPGIGEPPLGNHRCFYIIFKVEWRNIYDDYKLRYFRFQSRCLFSCNIYVNTYSDHQKRHLDCLIYF